MDDDCQVIPHPSPDDTSGVNPPQGPTLNGMDDWSGMLVFDALPMTVTNGSTSHIVRPDRTGADTHPTEYDPLMASTMEVRLGSILSQMLGHQIGQSRTSRMPEGVEAQRAQNMRFYEEFKDVIETRYAGRVVVIANGAVVTVADSFEAVADAGRDAAHRLVFRAGGEKWQTRKLRWPISRK